MAAGSQTSVVGIFKDQATAQMVAQDAMRAGVPRENIHLSSSEGGWTSSAATGGAAMTGRAPEHHHGGFLGWLDSLFGGDDSDNEQGQYRDAINRGQCVVAVDAADDDTRDRIVDVMKDHDAIDIDETGSNISSGNRQPTSSAVDMREGSQSIPVVEEELAIGKRAVQRGGVRIYTRTVEQPVEEEVNLREEHVNVERHPVDRPVTDADANILRDQTIEVTETREEPVVSKRAKVVEEVVVGKETRTRTETVRDKVRKQEVEVEQLGVGGRSPEVDYAGAQGFENYDEDFRSDYSNNLAPYGGSYSDYQPAYKYGYQMASDQRYRGKNFEDVEDTLKTDYLRRNPESAWDRMRGAVRYGWERATGKRK